MKEIKLGCLMTIGAMLAAPNSQSQEIPNLSKKDSESTVRSAVKASEIRSEPRILPGNSTVENIAVEPIFTSNLRDQSNLSTVPNKTTKLAIKTPNKSHFSPKSIAPETSVKPLNSLSIISVGLHFFNPNAVVKKTVQQEPNPEVLVEKPIDYSTDLIDISRLLILPSRSSDSFNKLVVFGESLSDNGNLYRLKKYSWLEKAPYFEGRTSNGPVWTERLADSLKVEKNSKNFAVGGSNSGQMVKQVEQYLNVTPKIGSDDIHTLWIGANDYYVKNNDTELTIKNVRESIKILTSAGAKKIIFANIMDLGNLPHASGTNISTSDLSQRSQDHNQRLHQELGELASQRTDLYIVPLDFYALFDQMFKDPTRFGFRKDSQSCFITCVNPNEYILLDSIHPTEAANRILSDYTLSILNAPQTIAPQIDLVSGVVRQQNRVIDTQLDLQRRGDNLREDTKFTVFTSGELSLGEQSGIYSRSGDSQFNSTAMTIGIIRKIGPDFSFGAAFNQAKSYSTTLTKNDKIIIDSYSLSLYAQKRFDRLFVNGIFNYGWNNFDVSRALNVTGFDTATARPVGNQFSTQIKIGYDFGNLESSGLKLTPTIGFGYQNISIADYTESNGNILNLKVKGQNSSAAILMLGGQLSYDIRFKNNLISPYLNVNYEHALTNGSREITTELITQAGIPMRSQTPKIDPNSVRLGLGVRGQIQDSFFVVLGYETVLGGNSSNSHAIQGQLQYRF
jgi:outer membrane lipase/esterase